MIPLIIFLFDLDIFLNYIKMSADRFNYLKKTFFNICQGCFYILYNIYVVNIIKGNFYL